MYSVVLMAALTAGSTTPDWHHCASCGSYGGYGPGFYGGGYQGCGCWGGYATWGACNMPPPNPVTIGGYGVAARGTAAPGTRMPYSGTGDEGEELDKPKETKSNDKETMAPAPAKMLIELPADAKLFIDDMPIKTAVGVQRFDTPALEPDKVYFYTVRIEKMRDGQPFSETRRILVRAGQVARTEFKELEPKTSRTARAE